MAVELRPDMRVNWQGEVVEFLQWQVWVDDVHCAYLDHALDSELRPHVVVFPVDRMQEILKACEEERSRLGKPSRVAPPPEYNLRFIECHKLIQEQKQLAEEEDDDE